MENKLGRHSLYTHTNDTPTRPGCLENAGMTKPQRPSYAGYRYQTHTHAPRTGLGSESGHGALGSSGRSGSQQIHGLQPPGHRPGQSRWAPVGAAPEGCISAFFVVRHDSRLCERKRILPITGVFPYICTSHDYDNTSSATSTSTTGCCGHLSTYKRSAFKGLWPIIRGSLSHRTSQKGTPSGFADRLWESPDKSA